MISTSIDATAPSVIISSITPLQSVLSQAAQRLVLGARHANDVAVPGRNNIQLKHREQLTNLRKRQAVPGTFLSVAKEARLQWFGCEIEQAYHEIAARRLGLL